MFCIVKYVLKPPGSLLLAVLKRGFWSNSYFVLIGFGVYVVVRIISLVIFTWRQQLSIN